MSKCYFIREKTEQLYLFVSFMNQTLEYYNRIEANPSLAVLYAGEEKCSGEKAACEGVRTHFLIHYICEGSGFFKSDNKIHKLGKGDAFIIFPGERHMYQPSPRDPWKYVWVGFTGKKAEDLILNANIKEKNSLFQHSYSKEIEIYFKNIILSLRNKPSGFEYNAEGHLYLILSKFMELNFPNIKTSPKKDYVDEAIQFIHSNFQRNITVDGISRHIGYHRSYFSTLFKTKRGQSLQEYLIHFRMEKAKELLKDTALTVSEVSSSVGYQDYFVFEKRFKKETGTSPSEFRQTTPSDSCLLELI
jgi:AraC family transcriptional regulator of arabinose operon